MSSNLFTLKNLVWGYKIRSPEYYEINYLLTIIAFSIYKSYYVSEQKTKEIDVFAIFRGEITNSLFMFNNVKAVRKKLFLIPKLLDKLRS